MYSHPKLQFGTLATLVACAATLAACGQGTPPGEDPVESIISAVGVAITGCADTGWDEDTATLTLTLGSDPMVLSAPKGKLTANGHTCTGDVGIYSSADLTTSIVSKIAVDGTSGDDTVILDLLPGSFGTKIFSVNGGVTVDFATNAGGNDEFMVRGGSSSDTYKVGKSTADTDVYFELTRDNNADVWVDAGTLAVTVSMASGNDVFTASPEASEITAFAGSDITVEAMTTDVTAYGGAGNDTLTGGAGDDTLHGGDGNDTFEMAATDDGSDTYVGDDGTDLVDYSSRTATVTVDPGPAVPSSYGSVDLTSLTWGASATVDTQTLILSVDGAADQTVTFATPASPEDLVDQINTQIGSTVARLRGQNQLMLYSGTSIEVVTGGSSTANLGLTVAEITDTTDADDGLAGEADDVDSTVESVTGGSGNDVIFGNDATNVLRGGEGDDILAGGANSTCDNSSDGDTLYGDAGDDTIYSSQENCWAKYYGGADSDHVVFSARGSVVTAAIDGSANDGVTDENGNISNDVEELTGGYGNDVLTGSSGEDTLNGGPGDDLLSGSTSDDILNGGAGADTMNGGLGTDLIDYSSYTNAVTVTLCVATEQTGAPTGCTADDGDAENDNIANVEHVIGGAGDDNMTASTVGATFEGNGGADTLTGGAGDDTLWGDAGDDVLSGGGGDDSLDGGGDDDDLDGGDGDGDICVGDASDVDPAVACELS